MGLFGGIGKALKGINWDRVSTGLSAAGASANGDHGQAANIWGQHRRGQQERAQAEAQQQQMQQAMQALIARGVPPQEAAVIVQGGGAHSLLAQHNKPQSEADDVFTRTLIAAGIDPNSEQGRALYAQRANTMASPAPQMIGNPETGYQWVQPPGMVPGGNPAPSGASSPPPQAIEALRNNPSLQGDFDRKYGPGSAARVLGGGAGNGSGTFQLFGRRTRF